MYGLDKESIRQQLEAQKFEERMSKNAMVNK
jgi:hypothetical protein